MAKTKRYAEIDMAKGIGILLVILGHIQYIGGGLRNFIVSFHIPLFFIVAGMLIRINQDEKKPLSVNVVKKCRSVLKPYLIFSAAFILAQTVAWKLGGTITLDLIKENIFLTLILFGMSVIWFLGALFAGELTFFLLFKLIKRKFVPVAVCVMLVISCYLNRQLTWYVYFHREDAHISYLRYFCQDFIRIGMTVFLIAVGFYARKLYEKMHMHPLRSFIAGVVGIAITVYISIINGGVDLHFLVLNNEILYFIGAICGSLGVISLCIGLLPVAHLLPFKVIGFYGRHSIIVMLTHVDTYLMYLSTIFVMHFFPDDTVYDGNVLFCICIFCLVCTAEAVIIFLINRYIPWIVGSAGRKDHGRDKKVL